MTWAAKRLSRPFVMWSAMALCVYLAGAGLGAAGAWAMPGAQLNPTNAIGSAPQIFLHNLVVVGLISAGAATLGITTAGILILNGGLFGFVAAELLERHQFGMFVTAVGPQLVPEVGAYIVAAGASLRLGWSIWWPLVSHRRRTVQWRQWFAAETAAILLLLAGAVIEVTYSHV